MSCECGITVEVVEQPVEVTTPEPEVIIIEVCSQGPAGSPGVGSNVGPVTIAPTNTEVVDTISTGVAVSAIWHVTATDTTGAQRSATVRAHWDTAGNTNRVVFARFGAYPAFGILVTNNAGTIELRITNNHALTIVARAVQLQVI